MSKIKANDFIIGELQEEIDKFNNGEIEYEELYEMFDDYNFTYSLPKNILNQMNEINNNNNNIEQEVEVEEVVEQEVEELEMTPEEQALLYERDNDEVLENGIVIEKTTVERMKSFIGRHKKATIACGMGLVVLVCGTVYAFAKPSKKANKDSKKTIESLEKSFVSGYDVAKTLNNSKEQLDENLNFNPLDKELEVTRMQQFLADALTKGIQLDSENLNEDIQEWLNFETMLNFDQYGVSDLAKLYQSDKVTYMDAYKAFVEKCQVIAYDSITASIENDEVVRVSEQFADKKDSEMVAKFENMSGQLVAARKAGDVNRMTEIAKEYNQLINDTFLTENNYSASSKVYTLIYAFLSMEIVQGYPGPQEALMSVELEKTLYVNNMCGNAEEDLQKYANGSLQFERSIYSKFVYELLYDMEAKYNGMYNVLIDENGNLKKFNNELSRKEQADKIEKHIVDNNLLSTFVANKSFEEYYYSVVSFEELPAEVYEKYVETATGEKVTQSEMQKYGVDISEPNAVQKYEEQVRKEDENRLSQETHYTDMSGNNKTKEEVYQDKSEIDDAYNAGVRAAAGKTTKITSAPSNYSGDYAQAYIEGYNYAVESNLNALKQNETTYESTTEQEVSKEEKIDTSAPIEDENIKPEDKVVVEEPVYKEDSSTIPPETSTPIINPDGTETTFESLDGTTTYEEISTYIQSINSVQQGEAIKEVVTSYYNECYYTSVDMQYEDIESYVKVK